MKICPKCHHEFEDNVKFCKDCGTPLVEQLTCPNCGEIVTVNDTFCGNCGAQLQEKKETVVSVSKEKKPFDPTNINKIFSIALLSLLLVLSFISFVSVFGEVLYSFDNTSGGGVNHVGLSFYRDMYNNVATASKQGYENFAAQLYNLTTMQLLVFILAIIGVLSAFAINITFLTLVIKKNFKLKERFLYIPFVLTLLHPLMFCFTYCGKIVVEGTDYQKITKLGWGTSMMLVAAIIAICLLLLYSSIKRNLLQAQKDKKVTSGYIVLEVLHLILSIAVVIIVIVSSYHVIRLYYRETTTTLGITKTYTIRGYGSAMSDYLASLLNAEMGGDPMPKGTAMIAIGHSIFIFAFMLAMGYFSFIDSKKLVVPTITGLITVALLVAAFSLSYLGESALISQSSGSSSLPPDSLKYSILAILSYILIPVTLFVGLLKKTQLESMKSAA